MYLYRISMTDKETGERITLKVPGNSTDDATYKVAQIGCFGINGPYKWDGSGPEYDDKGKLITVSI